LGSSILLSSQTFSFYIQRALNKNLIPAIIYIATFVIHVGLCIGLTFAMGIWGCIVATAFTHLVQAVALSLYNSRIIKLKQRVYWLAIVLNTVLAVIPAGLTYLLYNYVSLNEMTFLQQTLVRGGTFLVVFIALEYAFNRRFIKEFLHTLLSRKEFIVDANNKLQVLIPTMNCNSESEVRALLVFLRVNSNAIVANQGNFESAYEFTFENHAVKVINTKTRGVSLNRNILLNALEATIGLFTDDDCALMPNYEQIVIDFFVRNRIEAAHFNGLDKGVAKISKKKTCFVINFNDVSRAGGPGIAITKKAIEKYHLSFNEKLGTPNRIYNGEDSYFMFQLVQKGVKLFRSSKVVFDIIEGDEASSYFKGHDEQYFISRGAINKLVHPVLYKVYKAYYSLRLEKKAHKKAQYIYLHMSKGEQLIKKGQVIDG
jgi:hypothetical protein